MAADTYYFLLSPSACLICTSSLRWPAAIFSAECFLSVMAEDKRGLKIRSISMDFRFESPGECWALWKDSERATKGKTPKEKKNQFLMIYGPNVLFFQDTHTITSVKTNIVIRFLWRHFRLQVITQSQNFIFFPHLLHSEYAISLLDTKLDHSANSLF